jgi:MoxR-like ATPase
MIDRDAIRGRFREQGFIVGDQFATALQLMVALGKPLLLEGPAGVGKTESAKVLAAVLATRLIRLQCYEGLDALTALYEWNYPRQMLRIRMTEGAGGSIKEREAEIFGEEFLLKRPLLEAIMQDEAPVLLIDEVDRADEAFEAFLLEVLAEWQVTVPELGTIRARRTPYVILTSNRTRELSDALRRRCLFFWIPYPSLQEEIAILHARIPDLSSRLAQKIAEAMQVMRGLSLQKPPGVAEALDWARALVSLHREHLDRTTLEQTVACVLKVREDQLLLESQPATLGRVLDDERPLEPGGRSLDTDFGLGSVSTPR